MLVDVLGAGVGTALGLIGDASNHVVSSDLASDVQYRTLALLFPAVWCAGIGLLGGYAVRRVVGGIGLYRRVVDAAFLLLGATGFTAFLLRANLSRSFVVLTIPCALLATLVLRYLVRVAVRRRFVAGAAFHRVVAVGSRTEVHDLIQHVHRRRDSGYRVVGAQILGAVDDRPLPDGVPRIHGVRLDDVVIAATEMGADTLAVAGANSFSNRALRELAWQLEATDLALVVAPAMTDLAGPRLRVQPVDGLPLMHLDRPQLSPLARTGKAVEDRVGAALALVVLSPVLLATALAVKLTSPGPILYRQRRVGIGGAPFSILKFRTMRVGADAERAVLAVYNDSDGPLFKMRRDPRTTPIGRMLRRLSLDELPQLWNVLRGEMSLVGPRPPLPEEVAVYGDDARRRLLVKPGITGLWQVSGRADLPWGEAIRLDLHYVEHWSPALDFVLLLRTVGSVLSGRGAY